MQYSIGVFMESLVAFWMAGDKSLYISDPPISFITTPVGISYVILLFLLSFGFGFIYQSVIKQIAAVHKAKTNTPWVNRARSHNIGRGDRMLRAGIGVFLFSYAILTSWSPMLLFFSGFCFFEAIFSWCGFYAAIGKNSCPI